MQDISRAAMTGARYRTWPKRTCGAQERLLRQMPAAVPDMAGTWHRDMARSDRGSASERLRRMSIAPGLEPPWWLQEALAREKGVAEAPPLQRDLDVDVAIVGGGYTGLWTALALRERDPSLRVAVLEAAICGAGPSGRNGGFLHGYWASLPRLLEVFGETEALALCSAGDEIVPAVRAFAAGRGADVWLREGGLLKVATTPAQEHAVDRAVEAAKAVGHPGEAVPLSRDGLAARCRSPVFRRGVVFRDGATVQPARLVRALRAAVLDAGVELHEQTPVLRLRAGQPNRLETPGGTVQAPEAVVAVNASLTDWRPVRGRITVFGSYVVLTEPVPELLERIGWTGGEAIIDARMFLHYFRTTPDGRVLMGSGSGPIGYGKRLGRRFTHDVPTARRAERGLRRLLPDVAEARVTHAWGGPIDVSADQLPFVGTVPDARVHYAAGFSGNGVGPSWLAAQALASLVTRASDQWARLPLVGPRGGRVPPEPIRFLGGSLIRAAALASEEADEQGRRAALPVRLAAELPRALGMRLGRR
jgi:glycine/D-amino acid oxidase-like deaminating enzyme